jgi:hypothetical protein
MIDKTHSEHNESALLPGADIAADIAVRRLGPRAEVSDHIGQLADSQLDEVRTALYFPLR